MRYYEVTNEITGELCVVVASNEGFARLNAKLEFITAGAKRADIHTDRMAVAEISEADYNQWYGN